MTALPTPHPSWSLPYRVHRQHPDDEQSRAEWAMENLVEWYVESDDERCMQQIADHRPDLSWSLVFEAVERLCALSVDIADLRDNSAGRWPAYDSAADEYAAALAALAAKPVGA